MVVGGLFCSYTGMQCKMQIMITNLFVSFVKIGESIIIGINFYS